jgi:Ankyrin repeats (many copies)
VVDDRSLFRLMQVISSGDGGAAARLLQAAPELASAQLSRGGTRATAEDFFLRECYLQLYSGDTALHVAAAAYDTPFARKLIVAGADVGARNRRGGQPLHSAVNGAPGTTTWDPQRQAAMVTYLIEAGADPDAVASGGVTPLHRAVRNRCSAAVRTLLDAGADPHRTNDSGSTALMLAGWTTGRGGSGTPEAKAEQAEILRILMEVTG